VINVSSLVCKQLLCSRSYKSVLTVIHSHCPCNWGNRCIVETTNLFYSAYTVPSASTAHEINVLVYAPPKLIRWMVLQILIVQFLLFEPCEV